MSYGDYEPEDSWDRSDPIPIQIDNLLRRVALVEREPNTELDRGVLLDLIEYRLARVKLRRDLSPRDQLRIQDTEDDVAFVRSRLEE